MQEKQFLILLDELLELPSGSLDIDRRLDSLQSWDSLTIIGFIALLDEHYQKMVPSSKIRSAQTVRDLFALADE
jgi:acyl carrier protein